MCFSEQKSQYLWSKNVRHAAPLSLKKGEKERKCKNGNAASPIWSRRLQLIKEPRRVCARRRKESPAIFFGDMCGEENTSQAASVEFVRRRRTNYARSRLQPLCQKGFLFDSLKRRLSRFRDRRLVFGMGSFGAFWHAQRSELVAALVLPVHCQLAISGRSTPCAAMYCRCSTSLSRICCTV